MKRDILLTSYYTTSPNRVVLLAILASWAPPLRLKDARQHRKANVFSLEVSVLYYDVRMRLFQRVAFICLLLLPIWSPTDLLRAQGLFASRTPSRSPVAKDPRADSKTQPATAVRAMLADKVEPVRSNPRRTPAFIENRGQFDERVRFQLAAGGSRIWLTASGISFETLRPKDGERKVIATNPRPDPRLLPRDIASDFERLVVSESFVAANRSLEFEPRDPQPGIYNYLIGNDPAKWHTNIKGYAEVVYRNVWDGVDLRLYPNGSGLEQEFVLAPAGDPSRIQITYKGINALRLAEDGSLIILTAFGQWRESPPKVYQEVAGKHVAINARFKVTGEATYAFDLGSYRKEYALVIDPTLLYSTYIGGSGQNNGTGIAVDPSGNAYISGYTYVGTLSNDARSLSRFLPIFRELLERCGQQVRSGRSPSIFDIPWESVRL